MEATGAGGSMISLPPPPPAAGARVPLGELNLLNQYSHHHSRSNHCWTIESLAIPNIGSRDAIDLMKHKDYDLACPTS